METSQENIRSAEGVTPATENGKEFAPGAQVVYGLHGRCAVTSVETRTIGGQVMRFYKLEIQRSALARSTRPEPAIWLPVDSAAKKGLRAPMDEATAEAVEAVLSDREYYFPLDEPFSRILPRLETTVTREGAVGLAKAVSYLHVLKKKQVIPAQDVARFDETVRKALAREMAELRETTIRAAEEAMEKMMRHKLLPDH